MEKNKEEHKILSVWIDLIGTKDKIKKLNNQDFLDYLHKFNEIVINSIYESRLFKLFQVEGFDGKPDPSHGIVYRYVDNIKMLIFADTIYLEIPDVEWVDHRVLFWLKDLYEKCGDEYPLSIYMSVGGIFVYSKEMRGISKKLKEDLDIMYPSTNYSDSLTVRPPTTPVSEKIEMFTMFGLSRSLEKILEAESLGKRYNLGEGVFIQKDIWNEFVKGEKNLKNKPIDILFYHDGERVEFIKIKLSEILGDGDNSH